VPDSVGITKRSCVPDCDVVLDRPGGCGENPHMDEILPGLADALEAMNRGNVEPIVALLDSDGDWRGRPRGHLWWRHSLSCHGPGEARENLRRQVVKGEARPGVKEFSLEKVAQVGECVVLGGRWTMADGSGEIAGGFSQVLRVRGGRIVDIQGCTSRRAAMAYARRSA
jgi:ketosteroid isomerase-like protein